MIRKPNNFDSAYPPDFCHFSSAERPNVASVRVIRRRAREWVSIGREREVVYL